MARDTRHHQGFRDYTSGQQSSRDDAPLDQGPGQGVLCHWGTLYFQRPGGPGGGMNGGEMANEARCAAGSSEASKARQHLKKRMPALGVALCPGRPRSGGTATRSAAHSAAAPFCGVPRHASQRREALRAAQCECLPRADARRAGLGREEGAPRERRRDGWLRRQLFAFPHLQPSNACFDRGLAGLAGSPTAPAPLRLAPSGLWTPSRLSRDVGQSAAAAALGKGRLGFCNDWSRRN